MTIRLQSMYECQVKPILTSYRSRKKGSKGSSGATPQKNQKKRVMPARASSNANSPRKNPVRNAASKNPYLQCENGGSSDEDHERRYATRKTSNGVPGSSNSRKLRSRNSTTTSSSTNRSLNGHSSRNGISPPTTRPTRKVKRYRISSGESMNSHRSNGRGQQRQKRSTRVASSGSGATRKRTYVEDQGSDEFEDSDDVPMPHLHAAGEGNDSDDGSNSDNEASRGSLRRSSRVQNLMGSSRRSLYYENDSDDHTYGKLLNLQVL